MKTGNELFAKITSIIGILVCIWGIFAVGNISGEMGHIDTGDIMRLMQLGFVPLLGLLIAIVGRILGEICKNKPDNLLQRKGIIPFSRSNYMNIVPIIVLPVFIKNLSHSPSSNGYFL